MEIFAVIIKFFYIGKKTSSSLALGLRRMRVVGLLVATWSCELREANLTKMKNISNSILVNVAYN